MTIRRKIGWVLFIALVLPLAGCLGYALIFEPLKFRYLIWRVESAKTPAEERAAFALAARRGDVWELNLLYRNELPERARHIANESVLELEWMESSMWTGAPFRAYRHVLDTNNLTLFFHPQKP